MKINKTYTLRFVKLPPAAIALGKPFDIIFSLTDDLGLEVPSFPDIRGYSFHQSVLLPADTC